MCVPDSICIPFVEWMTSLDDPDLNNCTRSLHLRQTDTCTNPPLVYSSMYDLPWGVTSHARTYFGVTGMIIVLDYDWSSILPVIFFHTMIDSIDWLILEIGYSADYCLVSCFSFLFYAPCWLSPTLPSRISVSSEFPDLCSGSQYYRLAKGLYTGYIRHLVLQRGLYTVFKTLSIPPCLRHKPLLKWLVMIM